MHVIEVDVAPGLHGRPAARFAKTAAAFRSDIRVENLSRGSKPANAKKILGVLGCGVEKGHRIRVSAEGEDEAAAIEAIRVLAEGGFGEATGA
jgi:phosphotransferase system HPr (HPr) family protein